MKQYRKTGDFVRLAIPLLALACGLYLILNASAPRLLPLVSDKTDVIKNKLATIQPQIGQNRLYIPKIDVDVAIVTGYDWRILEQGAWHRHPENGSPNSGGNFVLSAHRFNLGLTPQQTVIKSPFYNIDRIQPDDEIYVDYNGQRYTYKVTRRYNVERTATEIENRTTEAKMTLYSCDLRGEKAGREVIEATLVDETS